MKVAGSAGLTPLSSLARRRVTASAETKVRSGVQRLHLVAQGDEGAFGISASNADEILWRRERQGPKQNAVYQAENGGVCADAESDREHCDDGESGILAKHARAAALPGAILHRGPNP